MTTKFDAWTTDADDTPFLDWCVQFVALDLEDRVSKAEVLLTFFGTEPQLLLEAEFLEAAMLEVESVRAAIAR